MKIKSLLEGNKKRLLGFYGRAAESRFYIALLPMIWVLIFFVAPLLIVLKIGFSNAIFGAPPFSEVFTSAGDYLVKIELSFRNYVTLIRDSYYVTAFVNSVLLGSIATVICLVFGFAMAYGMHNSKPNIKTVLLLLVSLSFWTSFLIRIYSWMNLFSIRGFVNSVLMKLGVIDFPIQFLGSYYAVCLGLVFCYLPFMIFPIYAVLEKIDKSYIESAYDLGSHPTRAFWSITVPLSKPGILTGCILVFATSTGEFVIPELLGGANTVMFGRVLWTEFFTNLDWPMACDLSIAMMLFIILPVFIFQKKAKV